MVSFAASLERSWENEKMNCENKGSHGTPKTGPEHSVHGRKHGIRGPSRIGRLRAHNFEVPFPVRRHQKKKRGDFDHTEKNEVTFVYESNYVDPFLLIKRNLGQGFVRPTDFICFW